MNNDDIRLQGTSGHARIDALIREVVRVYEETFPGQIAAYYVEGSYADQTSLPTSDIDLVIIFRDPFGDAEARTRAEQLWTGSPGGDPEVDITIIDEESLRAGVPPNLKLGSQLIYGQDVCVLYPLLPIETWARERMHAAYWLLVNVYQRPVPVQSPLTFPAPSEEFYGYTNRTLHLPDGQEVPCTRNLVRTTGWAATALLAFQAREYVGRKRDCARLYRDSIGGEWASLLEEIAVVCRDEWQYLIPTAERARMRLRSTCERTLQFEQHFLVLYRSFLLEQLRSTDQEAVRFARWVQGQVPLDDREVVAMLQRLDQR